MNVTTGKVPKPQKVVIYGPEGVGKTTLASHFPDALFIDTEGGTHHFDVRRADPAPTSWTVLMGYVAEVAKAGPALCGTLVIDTADWAERLCLAHVCSRKGWASIEDGDYGKGYKLAHEEFGRLLDRLSDCVDAGVNVVVTAHAKVSRCEQPDEFGTYDRWTTKLQSSKNASIEAMVKEWADAILFCNFETLVVKPDKKDGGHAKAAGGKRVMYAEHNAAWDAKNRWGLPAKMPMDYRQIAAHVPVPASPAAVSAGDAAPPEPAPEPAPEPVAQPQPQPQPQPRADVPEHLRALRDLMARDAVDDVQLQSYCGSKGYCTAATPVSVYPADFAAYLVGDWDNVIEEIGEAPF